MNCRTDQACLRVPEELYRNLLREVGVLAMILSSHPKFRTLQLPAPKPATKEDVLNRLKELAQDAENANKQEIDNLKQSFYKLHNAELEAAKKQFTDNGGAEEDFVPEEDPVEVVTCCSSGCTCCTSHMRI